MYFNIRLMKIEEKVSGMANRDANRMTNIKEDILEKREMPRKVRDSSLISGSFCSIDVLS